MKKLLCAFLTFACICGAATAATFTSCGPGYILTSHAKIDGINAAECQKLWCRDLENGRNMGSGKNANSGYKSTNSPTELCDASGKCIECFGERRWCAGETPGTWNPEYGAYTRSGDNSTYRSYQKGSCFAWRLEKPECENGETAILQGGKWVCATASGNTTGTRASSIRRTGTTLRRPMR
ncbi:MAG: hypothetical protein K2M34_01785 [Alphaproteobacteria bacterium]|nr:hypothetical protein [Alphaproteobacteria bacterium]